MQHPRKKKINKLTPKLLNEPIQKHLADFKDDSYDKPRACPHCKSNNRKKHSIEKKLFCKLITDNRFKDIYVYTRRFQCSDCKKTYLAKSPFYDKIVDSITARSILICLYDSIYTFRHGMPNESFAHKRTNFSFNKIMRC
ncbi:hypothetical protein HYW99_00915 [Candidatus Woesearchaeota archaeon]|nr:hypothetical protein [Candidatus Woesearchaeota archaeon]